MDGLVPVVSAPKGSGGEAAVKNAGRFPLAKDPQLERRLGTTNKGGVTGIPERTCAWRRFKRYGIDEQLAAKFSPTRRRARRRSRKRAEKLVKGIRRQLAGRAAQGFGCASMPKKDMPKIKAKVLYVLSRTDKVFPAHHRARTSMAKLKAAGVSADYFEIDSELRPIPPRASTPPNGRHG